MATAPLTITVARSYEEFLAMAPAWSELHARAERPLPFLRHSWLTLSWQLRSQRLSGRLCAIMVSEAGIPVMAAAFLFTWRRFLPLALFLGSGTPQLSDALWIRSERTAEHAAELMRALAKLRGAPHRLRSREWPIESPLHEAIDQRLVTGRQERDSHYVRLSDFASWDDYSRNHLGRKMRGDHGRRLRRLEEQKGPIAFAVEVGEARRQALHWLMTTKAEWVERTGRKAPWLLDGSGEVFLAAALDLEGGPECILTTLRCNGRIIAAAFGLREGKTLYISKLAYDPNFALYSPGRSLMIMLLELAFSEGIALVDLMAGGVEWKHRFATGHSKLVIQKVRLR